MTIIPPHIILETGAFCSTGCKVDGWWGQYLPDRVADIAEAFITIAEHDDPRYWRDIAEKAEPGSSEQLSAWEHHGECADDLVNRLNEIAPDGWNFGFYEGEFFFWPICQWMNDDSTMLNPDGTCDDCAHCFPYDERPA